MKTQIFLLVLIISILCLASNCKKEEPIPIEFIPLNQEFLSYFAFPVGSWWVYEEMASGMTDSIYVTKYELLEIEDKKDDINYIALSYHLKNSYNEYYFSAGPNPHFISNDTLFIFKEAYNIGNCTYTAIRLFYSKKNDNPFSINENTFIKNIYDTLIIGNTSYNDVYQIENKNQEYGNQIKSEYYAKGIGIIIKTYFDGKIFELKNHFINQ